MAIGDLGGSVAVPIGGGPLPFEGHHGSVESVLFKRDGKQLVSASIDKTVKVYFVITAKIMGGVRNSPQPHNLICPEDVARVKAEGHVAR